MAARVPDAGAGVAAEAGVMAGGAQFDGAGGVQRGAGSGLETPGPGVAVSSLSIADITSEHCRIHLGFA